MKLHILGAAIGYVITVTVAALGQDSAKDLVKPDRTVNIRAVLFSLDGKFIAGCSGEPKDKGQVVLWDAHSHKVLWKYAIDRGMTALAFSRDGKMLAVGSFTETCILMDVATGNVTAKLPGHGESARSVAFSPDGKTLAVGSYDKSIRLWDWQANKVNQTLKAHDERVFSLEYFPDGKTLASGDSGGSICLWDAASGKLLQKQNELRTPMAFDPKGQWLATAGNDASVTLRSLKDVSQIVARYEDIYAYRVLVIHPSGKQFASHSGFNYRLNISPIDLAQATPEDEQHVRKLMAHWDSDELAIREKASLGLTRLGNVARPLLEKAVKESSSAEVRIRARGVLRKFDSPSPIATLIGHRDHVHCAAFSPDGELLATGGRDGEVLLWDTGNYLKKAVIQWPAQE